MCFNDNNKCWYFVSTQSNLKSSDWYTYIPPFVLSRSCMGVLILTSQLSKSMNKIFSMALREERVPLATKYYSSRLQQHELPSIRGCFMLISVLCCYFAVCCNFCVLYEFLLQYCLKKNKIWAGIQLFLLQMEIVVVHFTIKIKVSCSEKSQFITFLQFSNILSICMLLYFKILFNLCRSIIVLFYLRVTYIPISISSNK